MTLPDLTKPPRVDYFLRLIDRQGILQHSKLSFPDHVRGYSLDDNARALIVAAWYYRLYQTPHFKVLVKKLLLFIEKQQAKEGHLRTYLFLSYTQRFLSREWAEDSFGETIWALGFLLEKTIDKRIDASAQRLWDQFWPQIGDFSGRRTKAYCLLGLAAFFKRRKSSALKKLIKNLVADIVKDDQKTRTENWLWFENSLTYANAVLPWSLLLGGQVLKDKKIIKQAKESLDWLIQVSTITSKPAPIGQRGWYLRGGERAIFDQQPIEAGYMVLACLAAYKVTRQKRYKATARQWFSWFYGQNLANLAMIDKTDGGCYDGLESWQVNLNKGAESTICYLLAYLALADAERRIRNRRR